MFLKKQKKFTLKCAAGGLSLAAQKEMLVWLQVGKRGFLWRDFNPAWGYDVVVENVSNSRNWVNDDGDYVVEFTVTFASIGSYLAQSRWDGSGEVGVDEYAMFGNYPTHPELGTFPIYYNISGSNWIPWAPTYLENTIGNEYGIPDFDYYRNDDGIKMVRLPQIGNILTHFKYNYLTTSELREQITFNIKNK